MDSRLEQIIGEITKIIDNAQSLKELGNIELNEDLTIALKLLSLCKMRREGEFLRELRNKEEASPDNDYYGCGRKHFFRLMRLAAMPKYDFYQKAYDAVWWEPYEDEIRLVEQILPPRSSSRNGSATPITLDDLGLL